MNFACLIKVLVENAFQFNNYHNVVRVAERLSEINDNENIEIAGGGTTGVELSGEIATVLQSFNEGKQVGMTAHII